MKPAILYLGVSTSEQGKSGLGLAAQREALEQFAAAEGFTVADVVTEVASGKLALMTVRAYAMHWRWLRS